MMQMGTTLSELSLASAQARLGTESQQTNTVQLQSAKPAANAWSRTLRTSAGIVNGRDGDLGQRLRVRDSVDDRSCISHEAVWRTTQVLPRASRHMHLFPSPISLLDRSED